MKEACQRLEQWYKNKKDDWKNKKRSDTKSLPATWAMYNKCLCAFGSCYFWIFFWSQGVVNLHQKTTCKSKALFCVFCFVLNKPGLVNTNRPVAKTPDRETEILQCFLFTASKNKKTLWKGKLRKVWWVCWECFELLDISLTKRQGQRKIHFINIWWTRCLKKSMKNGCLQNPFFNSQLSHPPK